MAPFSQFSFGMFEALQGLTMNMAQETTQQHSTQLERDLQQLISRKQAAEKHIATLESRLYDLETEYIRSTNAAHGSLLKSLDGYHGLTKTATTAAANTTADTQSQQSTGNKGGQTGGHRHHSNVKGGRKPSDEDRVFSRSSATWRQSVRWCRAATGHGDDDDDFEAIPQEVVDQYDQDMASDFYNDNVSTVSSSTTNNSPKKKKPVKKVNKKR